MTASQASVSFGTGKGSQGVALWEQIRRGSWGLSLPSGPSVNLPLIDPRRLPSPELPSVPSNPSVHSDSPLLSWVVLADPAGHCFLGTNLGLTLQLAVCPPLSPRAYGPSLARSAKEPLGSAPSPGPSLGAGLPLQASPSVST